MLNHLNAVNSKNRSIFNIYVDLFDKGEFDEMVVTRESDEYRVDCGELYLGTLSQQSDSTWVLVKGTIPTAVIPNIASNIIRNVKN